MTKELKLKKCQLWKIVLLSALCAAPSMHASELSLVPFTSGSSSIPLTITSTGGLVSIAGVTLDYGGSTGVCTDQFFGLGYNSGVDRQLTSTPQTLFFSVASGSRLSQQFCSGGGTLSPGSVVLEGVSYNHGGSSCVVQGCFNFTCAAGNFASVQIVTAFTATC